MEGPISFWGYKEQESNLILPEHDDDDDDDIWLSLGLWILVCRCIMSIATDCERHIISKKV